MAVATESKKILANMAIKLYDFDPGATTVTEIAWVDMRDFSNFLAGFMRTIGTAAVTFDIIGNDESDGGGTDVVIKAHAVASEPNAVGDQIWLECTADEIGAAGGPNTRYVTARVSVATDTDEGVVTYIRDTRGGRFAHDALTADIIA